MPLEPGPVSGRPRDAAALEVGTAVPDASAGPGQQGHGADWRSAVFSERVWGWQAKRNYSSAAMAEAGG